VSPPSAEDQVRFLIDLQRLLDEGSFVATYKLALLLTLAEISIEDCDDSGASHATSTRRLAEAFARIYWRQVVPYIPAARPTEGRILLAATGKQAAILNQIARAHQRCAGSLQSLMRDYRAWERLLTAIARTIERMPLWRLQTVGSKRLDFLYRKGRDAHEIVLAPGVAYCFRRFHPLIRELVQARWLQFVVRIPGNHDLVGDANDLGEFMFGSERRSLADAQPILREAQEGRCLYCGRAVGKDAAVDHFVPWSRYAVDLGHNLVLSHTRCNGMKSDSLAAIEHLERWCDRNLEHSRLLADRFDEKGIAHNLPATWQITRWAYAQAESARAQVWVDDRKHLVGLDARWRSLPGVGGGAG
jgi:5-methylcytosine-specific restriction endonuclease McrA